MDKEAKSTAKHQPNEQLPTAEIASNEQLPTAEIALDDKLGSRSRPFIEPPRQGKPRGWWSRLWRWTGINKKEGWDWLDLLFVPILLTFAGIYFAAQQEQNQQAIEQQRTQDTALQSYLDQTSQLLIDEHGTELRKLKPDADVRRLMRARTVAVLDTLDEDRKSSIVIFLAQADLIERNDPVIGSADLNFEGADLTGVDLSETSLTGANFERANLAHADLSFAHMQQVNFEAANLEDIDFTGTDLTNSNLRGASFQGADFSGAELDQVVGITAVQLQQAKGDEDTKLPGQLQAPSAWSQ